ncbi:MAG TPA: hypothetical protein VGF99_04785 [Myxococcota bacterium]
MLRCAIVSLSLVLLSSLLALPAAAEEPTAEMHKAVDTQVVAVVKAIAQARNNKMSRAAVAEPDDHRVRFTGPARSDTDGNSFVDFVVEAGFQQWSFDDKDMEIKRRPELDWIERETGCVYSDGRVFVKRRGKVVPASSLKAAKKKATPAAATTCVAAADVG